MKNQTLLFVMNEATPDSEVRTYAALAATKNARLICVILAEIPTFPIGGYGALPYGGATDVPLDWMKRTADARKALEARSDTLEALLQSEAVSGEVHTVHCVPSDMRVAVARRALVADVAGIATNLRSDDEVFRAAAYSVLFDAPIPLVLNTPLPVQPARVFVAWNTEVPASRAIHSALPHLIAADEVVIGSFDPQATEFRDGEDPGADLAKWLSHHGCSVTVNQYPCGGSPVSTCIQRRAAEIGADLVVMGAFGRSRLQEFVFGSTTRVMLDQTTTPVLMAH